MKLQEAKSIIQEMSEWMKFNTGEGPRPSLEFKHNVQAIFKAKEIVNINNHHLMKTNSLSKCIALPTDEICLGFAMVVTTKVPADGDTYKMIEVNDVSIELTRKASNLRVIKNTNQLDLVNEIEKVESVNSASI